ncbi:unnamed protein product [Candidula unifasciata]|uniref:Ig-like domain-containing protein n=1 Tax=Candidula unifasciata TaxID=100452 RepID=A0A8S3Z9M3_9EUPU|nr:unnamed protein product [Candidula unifasciata]
MVSVCVSFTLCVVYLGNLMAASCSSRFLKGNELQGSKLFFKGELPSESVATQFGSIVLECEVGGSPPPTIHWLKDGVRLLQDGSHSDDEASYEDSVSSGSRRGLRLSSTRSRLYLDCVGEEDEGVYTCVAENAMLRKSQSTRLRVGEPARIYMWTVSRLEFENSKVQLFCRAEGNPEPTITWYDRDNKPIESDENYRITKSGDLIIRDITWLENMGGYTCVADNGFGTDTAQTFLYPVSTN